MKIKVNDLLVIIVLIFFAQTCYCQEWSKKILPGLQYSHVKRSTENGTIHIHILKIDIKNEKIKVKPELAKGVIGNLERTSDIAFRTNSIAAINGSFFETRKKLHLPVGLMIIDGQVVSKSILERAAIGITDKKEIIIGIPKTKGYVINLNNKKSVPIWGVNRPRKQNEVIIYTNEYGGSTRTNKFGKELIVGPDGTVKEISYGNSSIPDNGMVISLHGWSRDLISKTKVGDKIGLVYGLADKWKDVKQAVTGGPMLIRNGEIVHEESIVNEKFSNNILAPNSRTAAGITKDNELIFIVVDKQYPVSVGVTYDEIARIMKDAGAVNAIGLDGGHASTMYLDGKIVNYPKNRSEAEVSNAIVIKYDGWKLASKPKAAYVYKFVYKPPSEDLIAALKESAQLSPTTYLARPEDFGMYGLYDLYRRVIKPVIPIALKPGFPL